MNLESAIRLSGRERGGEGASPNREVRFEPVHTFLKTYSSLASHRTIKEALPSAGQEMEHRAHAKQMKIQNSHIMGKIR